MYVAYAPPVPLASNTRCPRGMRHSLEDIPVQPVFREKGWPRGGRADRRRSRPFRCCASENLERLQRPSKPLHGSPTGCHYPAGRYNGIPVCGFVLTSRVPPVQGSLNATRTDAVLWQSPPSWPIEYRELHTPNLHGTRAPNSGFFITSPFGERCLVTPGRRAHRAGRQACCR